MNNDLETIENYLDGQLSADERLRFETTLRTDPALADALAFYALAKHTAKVDARAQRQAELDDLRRTPTRSSWAAPMRWAAAASVVLLLGLGWYFLRSTANSTDAPQLAEAYITQNFDQLSTNMGGGSADSDSLTLGVGLYNDKKFAEAEVIFGDVLKRQPNDKRVLEYAGVVALRRGNYDQAIERFHRLGQIQDLISNPGPFLEALAHIKRGRPVDKERAKTLLERVIQENLVGESEAKRLVDLYP